MILVYQRANKFLPTFLLWVFRLIVENTFNINLLIPSKRPTHLFGL